MSGAGKTTLAKKLEQQFSAFRLCGDELISVIIKDRNDRNELERLRDPVEKILWDIAAKLLSLGVSVILDNGFWSREERLKYLRFAKQVRADVQVVLHYLNIPSDIIWHRIQQRNLNLPNDCFYIGRNELDEWMKWFNPPDIEELKMYDEYEVHSA